MQSDADKLKLFTGRANPQLAQKICDYLSIPLGRDHLPADRIGRVGSLSSTALGATAKGPMQRPQSRTLPPTRPPLARARSPPRARSATASGSASAVCGGSPARAARTENPRATRRVPGAARPAASPDARRRQN